MDSYVKIDRRIARFLAGCLWILPVVIVADEFLYRLTPDMMVRTEILIVFGYHTINLQSAVADAILIPALIAYTYYAFRR